MATITQLNVSAESESALSEFLKKPLQIHGQNGQHNSNLRSNCSKFLLSEPLTEVKFSESQQNLPTYVFRDIISSSIERNRVTLIAAETGSGKSTQIPQYILADHVKRHCRIVCILPKRLAVQTIAKHVAEECNSVLGQDIGYQVRFEDLTSPTTTLMFMTR